MAKLKHKSICYYCGKQACSYEHVPPRQMFKPFSCDSITVPSCEEHNIVKGGADQAIVSAFLIPLYNNIERYSLENEIMAAIKVAEPSFERAKRRAIESSFLKNPPESLQDLPKVANLVPSINARDWIKQLTAALVYDATQAFDSIIDWSKAIAWSPEWVPGRAPLEFKEVASKLLSN